MIRRIRVIRVPLTLTYFRRGVPILNLCRANFLGQVSLDDVADFVVAEAFERQPALEALVDFARVVFEAAQAGYPAVEDYQAVADQTRVGRALDRAARHHTAGHRADFRHANHVADFGLAYDRLSDSRGEQSEHGVANLLLDLVDDRVQPDVHIFLSGHLFGARFGPNVEADDHGGLSFRRARQERVRFGDRADAGMDHADFNLVRREPRQNLFDGLDRALRVRLEDDQQFLDLAGRHPLAQLIQAARRRALQARGARIGLAAVGNLMRLRHVGDDLEQVARRRRAFQSDHFDRRSRGGLFHAPASIVEQRADSAEVLAGDERIADAQRAVLDQRRRHRASPAVELRFEHRASRLAIRIGFEVENVRRQQNHFEQSVDVLSLLRRDLDHGRVAAPAVP